jgi:hypothetical protein
MLLAGANYAESSKAPEHPMIAGNAAKLHPCILTARAFLDKLFTNIRYRSAKLARISVSIDHIIGSLR